MNLSKDQSIQWKGSLNQHFGIKDYTLRHLETYISRYEIRINARARNETKVKIVSNLLGKIKGKKVLDVGCGCGFFSRYCYAQGSEVYPIDFSPIMTKYVKSANPKLNTCQASAEYLSYQNEYFDVVLALDVIEHLYRPELFLKEVNRVLKKDGRLILITDNAQTLPSLLKFAIRLYSWIIRKVFKSLSQIPLFKSAPTCTHVKIYKANEISEYLTKHKFRILKSDTFSNVPLFNIANRLLGPLQQLKKYKWNRIYFHAIKSTQ